MLEHFPAAGPANTRPQSPTDASPPTSAAANQAPLPPLEAFEVACRPKYPTPLEGIFVFLPFELAAFKVWNRYWWTSSSKHAPNYGTAALVRQALTRILDWIRIDAVGKASPIVLRLSAHDQFCRKRLAEEYRKNRVLRLNIPARLRAVDIGDDEFIEGVVKFIVDNFDFENQIGTKNDNQRFRIRNAAMGAMKRVLTPGYLSNDIVALPGTASEPKANNAEWNIIPTGNCVKEAASV